jgi:hypothetical protein
VGAEAGRNPVGLFDIRTEPRLRGTEIARGGLPRELLKIPLNLDVKY